MASLYPSLDSGAQPFRKELSNMVFARHVYDVFKSKQQANVLHEFCQSANFRQATLHCIAHLLRKLRVREAIDKEYGYDSARLFVKADKERAYEAILKHINALKSKQNKKTKSPRGTVNHRARLCCV